MNSPAKKVSQPSADWKSYIAPGVITIVLAFGSAWLGDHYAFAQINAQFSGVAAKVDKMPDPSDIVTRIEIDRRAALRDRELNDMKIQLNRIEDKLDKIILAAASAAVK